MPDISFAMQAKSDQLNAMDIIGVEPVITIRDVKVNPNAASQKVWVYYDGCNNRPWKPSVGMIRILSAGWGNMSENWIGKSVRIYTDPTVVYAGKEMGGIRIKAMSDIPQRGITATLALNKQQRIPYKVEFLSVELPDYPQDKFDSTLPKMIAAIESGKMSIEQVIAQCQKTGKLTQQQLNALEAAIPVNADEEEEI